MSQQSLRFHATEKCSNQKSPLRRTSMEDRTSRMYSVARAAHSDTEGLSQKSLPFLRKKLPVFGSWARMVSSVRDVAASPSGGNRSSVSTSWTSFQKEGLPAQAEGHRERDNVHKQSQHDGTLVRRMHLLSETSARPNHPKSISPKRTPYCPYYKQGQAGQRNAAAQVKQPTRRDCGQQCTDGRRSRRRNR